MKNLSLLNKVLVLISLVFLFSGCTEKKPKSVSFVNNYEQLKQFFTDPPADYRSAPLWDWNEKITEDGIDFHMKKFKEAGIGGIFVHPRPGLLTEYLSDEWLKLFDYTVKKGKELGMNVWIYDENSYPSGFAGGHVQAGMPDSYKNGTGMVVDTMRIFNPDSFKYEVILKQEADRFTDITADYQSEKGKTGNYYLFRKTYPAPSYWYGNFPYVDLLYKGVTEKFMEVTMTKGYEKYNGPDLGKTVKGIFTDEPNLEAAMARGSAFRWTPDLRQEFQKKWGYDLYLNLPSLVFETGNWKKVRHDYYVLILDMFIDRWAKPWYQYCEEKNMSWTGHYWEHGWPRPTEGIDEAAFNIWFQQPGVDMLGNELIPGGMGGQFGNTRAIRELLSSANQGGHLRTLSETYGGGGWEMDFASFKRLVDWEVVLGVNFVNQHLSYYSLKGVRKFDYPPSFTYHEPYWDDYKLMGDYIGRICLAASSGDQINDILVLQPNTTAWMYFSRKVKNPFVDTIQVSFKKFIYELERHHYEYDLGSENVLRSIGSVKGGKLTGGNRIYKTVVIPRTMENLDSSTFILLGKFLKGGGRVLSFRNAVPCLEGLTSTAINELFSKYPQQVSFAVKPDDEKVKEIFRRNNFELEDCKQLNEAGQPIRGELYHQRRILDDGQLVILVNSSREFPECCWIKAKAKSAAYMDLVTGKITSFYQDAGNGYIKFPVNLEPSGSIVCFISDKKLNEPIHEFRSETRTPLTPLNGTTVAPESDNVLVVNYLDLKSKELDLKDTYFMKAILSLFEKKGFKMGNPWQHKIQYKQDYIALDTFRTGTGFEATYRFSINKNTDLQLLKDAKAVVERPELWKVAINGQPVETEDGSYWIDREFHFFPIGDKLKKGENTLTLTAERMSVYAELMPVYITGKFKVNPLKQGFEIASGKLDSLGSWQKMGFPFYSQKVSYTQKFNISKTGTDYRVKLNQWKGTVAEVFVNGEKAGLITWYPNELNVEPYIREGGNEIMVKVVGSLKNTFGYFYKDSKKAWINGPGDWNEAPEKIPSPDKYFLMDYGLFEPFSLLEVK